MGKIKEIIAYPELQPQPVVLAAHPHEPAQVHFSPVPFLQLQAAVDWASAAFLPHWHPEPQPINDNGRKEDESSTMRKRREGEEDQLFSSL